MKRVIKNSQELIEDLKLRIGNFETLYYREEKHLLYAYRLPEEYIEVRIYREGV